MADTFRRDFHPLLTLLIGLFIIFVLIMPLTRGGCGPHEDYYQFSFSSMNTTIEGQVNVWDRTNDVSPLTIIETAIDSVKVITEIELNSINRLKIDSESTVSHWLNECLRTADIYKLTDDSFLLNSSNRKVIKKTGKIDLSVIKEGFALDKAILALRDYGTSSALIRVGDNYFALGRPEKNRKWEIEFDHNITIELVNKACTINENLLVVGRNATSTDAVASIISAYSPEEAIEFMNSNFQSYEALTIATDKTVYMTSGIEKYLAE